MKFSSKALRCQQSPMRKFHPYAVAAAAAGKKALCICTVTNNPLTGTEDISPEEREKTLTDMITIALDV